MGERMESAQTLTGARPAAGRRSGRREGEGALEQMDHWAAVRCAASGSLDNGARTQPVAADWKCMQEEPGCETDCLHLFLKEPSSGRVKVFAQRPLLIAWPEGRRSAPQSWEDDDAAARSTALGSCPEHVSCHAPC